MNAATDQILYIDDDPDDLLLFSEALASEYPQYEIRQAKTGQEGLGLMREMQRNPCLVILDMNMPKIDGRQILLSIRKNPVWGKVPVVIFTTSASEADVAFGSQFNASFVSKPMTYDELNATIKILVSHCFHEEDNR